MPHTARAPSADLHLHSTASDGSDAPADVVRRAAAEGFAAIALTDHDTMDGVAEARAAAAGAGLELIPGVEYSALDDEREIHVLGYGLDPADPVLHEELRQLAAGRLGRARRMVERLNAIGVSIAWDRVRALAGDDNVGRPHIARAMQEAGYIREIKDAFTPDYIATGGRCYVERLKISPEEAIAQIRAAGGVAVLAHPGRFRAEDDPIGDDIVERLIGAGLEGIEVFYPRHTSGMVTHYRRMADQWDLLMTGGSDDHGANGETSLGDVRLAYEHVRRLQDAITLSERRRTTRVAHTIT